MAVLPPGEIKLSPEKRQKIENLEDFIDDIKVKVRQFKKAKFKTEDLEKRLNTLIENRDNLLRHF